MYINDAFARDILQVLSTAPLVIYTNDGRTLRAQELAAQLKPRIPEELTSWLACEDCGCTDVRYEAWVDANTHQVLDDTGSSGCYCPQCNEYGQSWTEASSLQPCSDDFAGYAIKFADSVDSDTSVFYASGINPTKAIARARDKDDVPDDWTVVAVFRVEMNSQEDFMLSKAGYL